MRLQFVDHQPGKGRPVDKLTAYARLVGVTTDDALAHEIGVNVRHIGRARSGAVGEKFMAGAVRFLRRHEDKLRAYGIKIGLDELFEVTDEAA